MKSGRNLRRKPRILFSLLLAVCLIAALVLFSAGMPRIERLHLLEQTLTLDTVTVLPLAGYASLSFSEGGGLCRLHDQSSIDLLQTGQVYTLTLGSPPAHKSKGAVQIRNYSIIVSMTATDGTVITTQDAYKALEASPAQQALSLAPVFLLLLPFLYPVVHRIIRFLVHKPE